MRAWAVTSALLLLGCNETVGFLSIDVLVSPRSSPITCGGDLRRATSVSVAATCDGATVQAVYPVTEGTVALSQVPIGTCTIELKGLNRFQHAVLTASTRTQLVRGDNPPLKITLAEVPCDSSCDPDNDGLSSADEQSLGTSADSADTDGDGIEDGVELKECCTDPLKKDADQCKQSLIQRVDPIFGPAQETVLIKTSRPLSGTPQVTLGHAPLVEQHIFDNVYIVGNVSSNAILDVVQLSASGQPSVEDPMYFSLFSVLRVDAERVSDIDRRAAGTADGLARRLVDVAYGDANQLFLLGEADATPSSGARAVVVGYDRVTGQSSRIGDWTDATPVALVASGQQVIVLLQGSTGAPRLVIRDLGATGAEAARTITDLPQRPPVSLELEPDGKSVQILLQDALVRLPTSAKSVSEGAVVGVRDFLVLEPVVPPGAPLPPPLEPVGEGRCTGLAYEAAAGATYVLCNVALPCPPGLTCPIEGQGLVLRLATARCLPLATSKPTFDKSCWARSPALPQGVAQGSPVIDPDARAVYMLSDAMLYALSFDATAPLLPKQVLGFNRQAKASSPRLMALDRGSGVLYIADGLTVRRVNPRESEPTRRALRPMVLGREAEEVSFVALPPDRRTLDLERRRAGDLELVGHGLPAALRRLSLRGIAMIVRGVLVLAPEGEVPGVEGPRRWSGRSVSIGRAEGNDLVLPTAHISSRHAIVHLRGDGYTITDLDSTNGSLVQRGEQRLILGAKGAPEVTLSSGDLLVLGDIDHPVRLRVTIEEAPDLSPHTVVATRSGPEARVVGERSAVEGSALQVLYQLVSALSAPAERGRILGHVVEAALVVIPGAVDALVARRGPSGLSVIAEAHRNAGTSRAPTSALCERVLDGGEAALLFGADGLSASLLGRGVGSGVVVALLGEAQPLGVLQVNCAPDRAELGEQHLDLAVVLAHHAAMAVERTELIERLQVAEAQLREENTLLRRRAHADQTMVAQSPAMVRALQELQRAAASEITVLLQGETGTGKEVAARYLHAHSRRRERLLVPINCGALSESLLDSELFGHRKGAFTGANADRKGVFEVAAGGTVFLDEIGDTPPAVQVRLLRVLEEGKIRVLGEPVERPVDVRIIAATNRDLAALVQQGRFRQDLYYRLRVFPLTLPPLRERPEDIEPLCQLFLARYAAQMGKRVGAIDPSLIATLRAYAFPGNVRELANEIERAVVRAEEDQPLTAELLSEEIARVAAPAAAEIETLAAQLGRVEREIIVRVLARHDGRKVTAAEELGLTRQGLVKKMERLKIDGSKR